MRVRASHPSRAVLLWALALATASAARAEEPEPPPGDDHYEAWSDGDYSDASLTDLNQGLSNPVSDIWSITFQQNNFRVELGSKERWLSNLNLQPVLPLSITDDWNVITQPLLTLVNSVPHPDPNSLPVAIDRTTGFGDVVLLQLYSPSPRLTGDWILGAGPTFVFPTASSDWTGQGKWSVGPTALVGYLSERWIAGSFVQQWFSFAGSNSRKSVSLMNLQPFVAYFLPKGWSVGYSGSILANWNASGDDVWTVPVGVSVGRVWRLGKLPVRVSLAVQYMPIRPDAFAQKWNLQVTVAPVLPKLIRGNLADPAGLRIGLGE